ncbi:CDP-alcohol phosphatidyltransferase family protein [Breoghania sp.]|uniref:CDP-alcohol phosphatidyltransferase family protein n=1 Tax=Breoghania sp. TaxID=2065378 RepID=UPI00263A31BF|nr:CDP-alcohol phosphatidyltransferase family protein [Breoghania sp.]MDJ0929534.1 hypothetical protein [Breoghania sp.]
MMFAWLGVALVVDGVDGPLARAVNVTERLPTWSGAALDFVIDYATYVLLLAFAIATVGLMSTSYNLIAAGLVVVSGALYFAYEGMKLPDNCFRGFPVTWNMFVFVLFAFPDLQSYADAGGRDHVAGLRFRRRARRNARTEGIAWIGLAASSIYLLVIGALFQLADALFGRDED